MILSNGIVQASREQNQLLPSFRSRRPTLHDQNLDWQNVRVSIPTTNLARPVDFASRKLAVNQQAVTRRVTITEKTWEEFGDIVLKSRVVTVLT